MIDNQVLIDYVRDDLGGVIGSRYAAPYGEGRITIIDQVPDTGDSVAAPACILALSLMSVLVLLKKKPEFV